MASRLAFLADWLDPSSGVLWRYQLFYYVDTGEVEMFDVKNRRHFLKRVKYEPLAPGQLYPGAVVTVFARQLHIRECGDDATRRAVETRAERTLAMIKPEALHDTGKILAAVGGSGLLVANLRMAHLAPAEAAQLYSAHEGAPFFGELVAYIISGPVVAMELVGPGAVAAWRGLLGPTDPARARAEAPDSIRAAFGTDKTRNAAHGSDSPAAAARELAFFFGSGGGGGVAACGACGPGSAVAVVKPHAVRAGLAGQLLDGIQAHFDVTGLRQVRLDAAAAAEFLEVYKGVLPPAEWSAAVEELSSGPALAVEVAAPDGGAAAEPLRQLCGPPDPELGRALRPGSLRARFGASRVRNALHCTDLGEDGELEARFIFGSDWVA
ncbi:MAG: nucleoside diphosphate kinase [Monoraphidium minutum]|nr:MAG: nucleoside diphosphate kinase [Monoraphidium minutum]